MLKTTNVCQKLRLWRGFVFGGRTKSVKRMKSAKIYNEMYDFH